MERTVTASVSLPVELAKELAAVAKAEHRTRSGVIQEAARFYLEARRWRDLQREIQVRARVLGLASEADVETWVDKLRK